MRTTGRRPVALTGGALLTLAAGYTATPEAVGRAQACLKPRTRARREAQQRLIG